MSRYKAALIHFLSSCAVGATLLALFWFVWYPSPMLTAIGGHEIFILILGIDVTLGPLLTLVVFDPKKRSLKFDLAAIGLMQISALVYGVHVLLQVRPVYVASLDGSFQVVQATEVTADNLQKSKKTLPWFGPEVVGTVAPTDRYEIDEVQMVSDAGGGRGHFPQLHRPYEETAQAVAKAARPISQLFVANVGLEQEIKRWLASRNHDESDAVYQSIRISASEFAIVLDAKSGAVIGISPFKP